MNSQVNPPVSFDSEQEGGGGSSRQAGLSAAPELSIREWYEGTKSILKERTSYKHRLEMMVLVGAEPLFEFK